MADQSSILQVMAGVNRTPAMCFFRLALKQVAALPETAIAYLAAGQTIVWAGLFYSFPALLLRWELVTDWSKPQLTAAFSLALLASAVCSPLAGRQIDRGRGPQMMTGCAAVAALMLFGLSQAQQLWQFYLCWLLIGCMLAGCLYEPCFALLTRARGSGAKPAIIRITLAAGFAGSISFPAAHFMADAVDWRFALQVFAAIVFCVGVPLLWFGATAVERDGQFTAAPTIAGVQTGLPRRTPTFICLAVAFALLAVVHGVTLHHLIPILYERGLSLEVGVLAASFIGPMQVGGRIVMVALEHRVSNRAVASTCFVAMAVSVLLLLLASDSIVLIAAFVLFFGGGYGVVSIVRPVIARDLLGQANFGANSGLLAMFFLIGVAIAPWVGSLLWKIGGYNFTLGLLIVASVAGFFLYRAANR